MYTASVDVHNVTHNVRTRDLSSFVSEDVTSLWFVGVAHGDNFAACRLQSKQVELKLNTFLCNCPSFETSTLNDILDMVAMDEENGHF